MPLELPVNLVAAARAEGRDGWLDTIPATVRRLERHWGLEVGPPFQPGGVSAWVAPARVDGRDDVVLKVEWRHSEAAHEADGLRFWNGDGAVVLHAVEEMDDAIAFLLERCSPGEPLSDRTETDQDEVLAGLLPRLWIEPPAGHPFLSLQEMCDDWADAWDAKVAARGLGEGSTPAWPGRAWLCSARSRSTSDRHVLLGTDLHAGNVLSARRQPWLVIDPKPYVGDPTYDPLQHMLNCHGRLDADPHGFADRMAELLELDAERLRLWLFARCVQEALEWQPDLSGIARRLARLMPTRSTTGRGARPAARRRPRPRCAGPSPASSAGWTRSS